MVNVFKNRGKIQKIDEKMDNFTRKLESIKNNHVDVFKNEKYNN